MTALASTAEAESLQAELAETSEMLLVCRRELRNTQETVRALQEELSLARDVLLDHGIQLPATRRP